MKTLSESIAEYNADKLKINDNMSVPLSDVKAALLSIYRNKGVSSAKDILSFFNIEIVEDLSSDKYDLFMSMCERELK